MNDILRTNLVAGYDFTRSSCLRSRVYTSELTKSGGSFDVGYKMTANGHKAETTTPEIARVTLPFTVACVWRTLGANTNGGGIFGITHNATDGAPYAVLTMSVNGTTGWTAASNTAGAFYSMAPTGTLTYGEWHVLCVQITANSRRAWFDTRLAYNTADTQSNPTYGATSLIYAGSYTGIDRNSNGEIAAGYIWKGEMGEIASRTLVRDWFAPIRPRKYHRSYKSAAAPSFSKKYSVFNPAVLRSAR